MPLLGELDLSGAGFLSTLKNLDKGFGDFTSKLGKFGAIAGGSFVAFQGLQTVMDGFKETLDLGGTLQDLNTTTGESVGDLVILRQAFDNAGLGAEGVAQPLLKLQDAIAGVNEDGKSTAGALRQLGTSAAELRNLPAIGQIEKLQAGFAKLDQTARVQAAKDLFGGKGVKALSLFGDSEALAQARQQAGPLAQIMQENVASFDRLGDSINGLKLNFQEFFAGALSKLAPTAADISDAFGSIDFRGIGEAVGSLASVFLKLADILAGPTATALNFVSKSLDFFLGASPKAAGGNAIGNLSRTSPALGNIQAPVAGLQKLGGGGGFGGAGDASLNEARNHTRILERIAAGVERLPRGGDSSPMPTVPV